MEEHDKTQLIRILDVVGVGPLLIYAGMRAKSDLSKSVRMALVATGVATIGYNGHNFLLNEQEKRIRRRRSIENQLSGIVKDVES